MKILADQFFAAPFFAITFIFGMGLLEDKRISECWREFIMKFPAIYLVSIFEFLSTKKSWWGLYIRNRSFSSIFIAYFSSLFPSVRLDNLASYAIHQFQIHTSICACTLCKYNHSFVGYFPFLHKTHRRGK